MAPGISLSGAWLGRGFHEDGFVAGRRAAIVALKAAGAPCSAPDVGNGDYPMYEGKLDLEVPEPTGGAHAGGGMTMAALVALLAVAACGILLR